ncbi:trigger factor [Candidatus Falkowbacteria bacterium]|nr:trigger factor [Candidatus Falkowbacteria bacterium]
MQVNKKDLEKSQVELTVELSAEEFAPFIENGAKKLSEKIRIEGFRPGKAPLEVLKAKIGEMSILEEAAQLAVNKTLDDVLAERINEIKAVGQPNVNISKLAPNNPFEYKVTLSVLPEIELGKYKDLGLKTEEAKVEEKELDKILNDLREMRAKEVLAEKDKAIEKGDKVVVDIKLFDGKVPLEEGVHNDLALLTGKNYFVPGFDEKIIGAKNEAELKFQLPYPEDHHQKNLAGKMINFEVKIKSVFKRELPELNDDFAKDFRVKDLEALKKDLQENVLQEKKRELDLKNESEMISKILEGAKIGDLPEILIESESRNIMSELEQSVLRQGGKFEDYLNHLKKTRDELKLEMIPNAIKRVKSSLLIREIAVLEKIDASDKEIEEKISELKEQYKGNEEVQKMIQEHHYKHYLKNILTNEKVLAKLKEWNYASTGAKQKS